MTAPRSGPSFRVARVLAMVLRYLYLLRGSWPRALELFYWPILNMVMWGFTSQFMMTRSSLAAQAFGVFLGAVLLWDVFVRGQLGVSATFLEEIWSRNLGHLFASPLRPSEWVAAMLLMSFLRAAVSVLPAALLAIWFYHYSIFAMGPPLIGFLAALLIMGWALGLMISALILLNGLGAEGLAWFAAFALAPISAIYYPVSVLPAWLQPVARAFPAAHVFEGMRGLLFKGTVERREMLWAFGLDALYLALGIAVFLWAFDTGRRRGALLQTGE
jgi:ABC-2 type transport system permease protein